MCVCVWRGDEESTVDRGNSLHKGPEAGAGVVCARRPVRLQRPQGVGGGGGQR